MLHLLLDVADWVVERIVDVVEVGIKTGEWLRR